MCVVSIARCLEIDFFLAVADGHDSFDPTVNKDWNLIVVAVLDNS